MPLGANYMNIKKYLLMFLLSILIMFLLLPVLVKHDNIGSDLKNITIKRGTEKIKFNEIRKNKNNSIVVFYSYKCSACKKLLTFKSLREKFIFINVDIDKKIPENELQLLPQKELQIFFLPYIVKYDSSYIIIKEYKLYDFLDKISNVENL